MVGINKMGFNPMNQIRNCQPLMNNKVGFAGRQDDDIEYEARNNTKSAKKEISIAHKAEVEEEYIKVRNNAETIRKVRDSVDTSTTFGRVVKPLINVAAGVAFAVGGFMVGKKVFYAVFVKNFRETVLPPVTNSIKSLTSNFNKFKDGIKPGKKGEETLLAKVVNTVSDQCKKVNTKLSKAGKGIRIEEKIAKEVVKEKKALKQLASDTKQDIIPSVSSEFLRKTRKESINAVAHGAKNEKAQCTATALVTPVVKTAGGIGGMAMGTYLGAEVYENNGDPDEAMRKIDTMVQQVGINPEELD
jgi:hypothetical protein